jgi:cytidine deaminase
LAAENASQSSYSPYSKFTVGSALLLEDNNTTTGSNQENAVYPSGLCAERVALFSYGHKFKDQKLRELVVQPNIAMIQYLVIAHYVEIVDK